LMVICPNNFTCGAIQISAAIDKVVVA